MTNADDLAKVWIAGEWRKAHAGGTFRATNPKTREPIGATFPISTWADCDAALTAADQAARALRQAGPARIADFLEAYAAQIELRAEAVATLANAETALPVKPRLQDVELPRTTGQLRQAAAAARDGSWVRATIDTKLGLRSCLAPLGPVFVIGPNNFPFAFNAISGGDFAAVIASGNPVIAKAHPLHPGTSQLLAEAAAAAAASTDLPPGAVQMLYHIEPAEGLKMVGDPRLKAIAFTGSRTGGMRLKAAADAAGKLFYGEMSSLNPVVILPGAIAEKADDLVGQFVGSVLMGTGQFCTNPGLVLLRSGPETEAFLTKIVEKMAAAPVGTLFSEPGQTGLLAAISRLRDAGATVLTGGTEGGGAGFCVKNTLLRTTAKQFIRAAHDLQTEAFGNASLVVVADTVQELTAVIESLEGNLTGTIYSSTTGADDEAYGPLATALRPRVGRLINDKMPTGVAVSPAMNHGGPYPATSQPHFTAVGIPTSLSRFTQLESYDGVRAHRLPPALQDKNPTGKLWRCIDGNWSFNDVAPQAK